MAKSKKPANKPPPAQPTRLAIPFVQDRQLEWAILAPLDALALEDHVLRLDPDYAPDPDFDDSRSWCIVAGKGHSAVIETAPGSTGSEDTLAAALSKALHVPIYALGFVGYDDPDHGLPYIQRYDEGKSGLIWMAASDDDDSDLVTVGGPKGIPATDPFEFAEALGCKLRPYYDR